MSNLMKIRSGIVLSPQTSDPSLTSADAGAVYYNSTLGTLRLWNGSIWQDDSSASSVTTDSTTTGSAALLQSGDITYSIVRLTNASLASVAGIPVGVSGQTLIVENHTGVSVIILDNSGATTTSIRTGTGASVTMTNNSTFVFTYDTTSSRWMLTGGAGSGSGSGSGSKNYLSAYTASTAGGVVNTGNGNFEFGSTTGWSVAYASLTSSIPTQTVVAGQTYANNYYSFSTSALTAAASIGAIYTNNGQTFTVAANALHFATTLICTGTGAPSSSGTLTYSSGSAGPSSVTFSSATNTTYPTTAPTLSVVSGGTQIGGSYSGSLALTSSTTAGSMLLSNAFYIDAEDQAKVLNINLNYQAVNGTGVGNYSGTTSNTFGVFIYDVTNGAWIMPAGAYNFVQGSGVGYCLASFQTTSNSTQYQIGIFVLNDPTGTLSLTIDDISVGPQVTNGVIPQTNTVSTATYSTVTGGFGTPSAGAGNYTVPAGVYQIKVRMVGGGGGGGGVNGSYAVGGGGGSGAYAEKTLKVVSGQVITYQIGAAGTAGTSAGGTGGTGGSTSLGSPVSITCGGGVGGAGSTAASGPVGTAPGGGGTVTAGTPDTTIAGAQGSGGFSTTNSINSYGGTGASSPFGDGGVGALAYVSYIGSGANGYGSGGGGSIGAGYAGGAGGNGYIEITEYYIGANVQMSSDTDTRVVAMQATNTPTATLSSSYSLVKFGAATQDTHGGFSASTGLYTVPVTGYYRVSTNLNVGGTIGANLFVGLTVYQNGAQASGANATITSTSQTNAVVNFTETIFCKAGDTLAPYAITNITSPVVAGFLAGLNFFCVERLSGPAVIAATESVNGLYTDTSGGSIGTSAATYTYATKVRDTHNAYNSGTLTIPVSGMYTFNAAMQTAAITLSTTQTFAIFIYRNGTQIAKNYVIGNGATVNYIIGVTTEYPCMAGDTITVEVASSVSTTAVAGAGVNNFSWARVGN